MSKRSRDMRRSRTRPSVAVIGSGVIGLTVATELRRKWRHLPITIYSKELDVRKTTSFVAGGQFAPSGICDEYDTDDRKELLADYLRRSRRKILEIGIPHDRTCMASHLGETTPCSWQPWIR